MWLCCVFLYFVFIWCTSQSAYHLARKQPFNSIILSLLPTFTMNICAERAHILFIVGSHTYSMMTTLISSNHVHGYPTAFHMPFVSIDFIFSFELCAYFVIHSYAWIYHYAISHRSSEIERKKKRTLHAWIYVLRLFKWLAYESKCLGRVKDRDGLSREKKSKYDRSSSSQP